MQIKRLLTLGSMAVLIAGAVVFTMYSTIDRPPPVSLVSISLAKVNLGSSADDVDAAMGMSPATVTHADGYLMGPMVMLTPENELAPKDQIEPFTLRKYTDDGLNYAVVAMRPDGTVAGKWTGQIKTGG